MQSGLAAAKDMLAEIKGISFIELDQTDVVRHPLVAKIIGAYEKQNELSDPIALIGSFCFDRGLK